METEHLIALLRELRDTKYYVASCALKRSYLSFRCGADGEAGLIRAGALQELRQVFALEEWIGRLGGVPEAVRKNREGEEVQERYRLLHLVKRNLPPPNGSRVVEGLRAFLLQLAEEEKRRIEELKAEALNG